MRCTVKDFAKDSIVYTITGTTREELENRLNLFFTSQNLAVKKDTPGEKIYQRGNKALRILLGVFIKYFKIVVQVAGTNEEFTVKILRDMNFIMSGGLVGMQKSRTEFGRINDAFKVYFN